MRELACLRRLATMAQACRAAYNPSEAFEAAKFTGARVALFRELEVLSRAFPKEDAHGYFYVASPYTAKGRSRKRTEQLRYEDVCKFVRDCFLVDIPVYSPIAAWHPLASTNPSMGTEENHFEFQNRQMLGRSQGIIILMLDGWRLSVGTQREIALATQLKLPVFHAPDVPHLDDPLETVRAFKKEIKSWLQEPSPKTRRPPETPPG